MSHALFTKLWSFHFFKAFVRLVFLSPLVLVSHHNKDLNGGLIIAQAGRISRLSCHSKDLNNRLGQLSGSQEDRTFIKPTAEIVY